MASPAFADSVATIGIPLCAVAGILFGLFLWVRVSKIKVRGAGALRSENGREYLLAEEQRGEQEVGVRLRLVRVLGLLRLLNACFIVLEHSQLQPQRREGLLGWGY